MAILKATNEKNKENRSDKPVAIEGEHKKWLESQLYNLMINRFKGSQFALMMEPETQELIKELFGDSIQGKQFDFSAPWDLLRVFNIPNNTRADVKKIIRKKIITVLHPDRHPNFPADKKARYEEIYNVFSEHEKLLGDLQEFENYANIVERINARFTAQQLSEYFSPAAASAQARRASQSQEEVQAQEEKFDDWRLDDLIIKNLEDYPPVDDFPQVKKMFGQLILKLAEEKRLVIVGEGENQKIRFNSEEEKKNFLKEAKTIQETLYSKMQDGGIPEDVFILITEKRLKQKENKVSKLLENAAFYYHVFSREAILSYLDPIISGGREQLEKAVKWGIEFYDSVKNDPKINKNLKEINNDKLKNDFQIFLRSKADKEKGVVQLEAEEKGNERSAYSPLREAAKKKDQRERERQSDEKSPQEDKSEEQRFSEFKIKIPGVDSRDLKNFHELLNSIILFYAMEERVFDLRTKTCRFKSEEDKTKFASDVQGIQEALIKHMTDNQIEPAVFILATKNRLNSQEHKISRLLEEGVDRYYQIFSKNSFMWKQTENLFENNADGTEKRCKFLMTFYKRKRVDFADDFSTTSEKWKNAFEIFKEEEQFSEFKPKIPKVDSRDLKNFHELLNSIILFYAMEKRVFDLRTKTCRFNSEEDKTKFASDVQGIQEALIKHMTDNQIEPAVFILATKNRLNSQEHKISRLLEEGVDRYYQIFSKNSFMWKQTENLFENNADGTEKRCKFLMTFYKSKRVDFADDFSATSEKWKNAFRRFKKDNISDKDQRERERQSDEKSPQEDKSEEQQFSEFKIKIPGVDSRDLKNFHELLNSIISFYAMGKRVFDLRTKTCRFNSEEDKTKFASDVQGIQEALIKHMTDNQIEPAVFILATKNRLNSQEYKISRLLEEGVDRYYQIFSKNSFMWKQTENLFENNADGTEKRCKFLMNFYKNKRAELADDFSTTSEKWKNEFLAFKDKYILQHVAQDEKTSQSPPKKYKKF